MSPPGAERADGDSDRVRVGEQVFVIGAPYGLCHSFSAGWISARWLPNTAYQRDAARRILPDDRHHQHGEFGRPHVQHGRRGRRRREPHISKGGGSEGLGFVVTMKSARYFLMERKWAWVGMEGVVLTGDLAEIFNVPGGSGLLVKVVPKESPAWQMGLQGGDRTATIAGQDIVVRGDIVLAMAGITIKTEEDLPKIREKLGAMPTGQSFTASVLRAGQVIELTGTVP